MKPLPWFLFAGEVCKLIVSIAPLRSSMCICCQVFSCMNVRVKGLVSSSWGGSTKSCPFLTNEVSVGSYGSTTIWNNCDRDPMQKLPSRSMTHTFGMERERNCGYSWERNLIVNKRARRCVAPVRLMERCVCLTCVRRMLLSASLLDLW